MGQDITGTSDDSDRDCRALHIPVLAEHCMEEMSHYHRGEPSTEIYGLELLRRATVHGDPEAWTWVQYCFGGAVRAWLCRHPGRDSACRLESEENYIAQAFERFWQAAALTRRVEFSTMAAAMQYLRASLNGAILDTLRTYLRSEVVPLPEPGEPGEPYVEDRTNGNEFWDVLPTMLPGARQQRLAYLLYHCGLKPREIVRFCPEEWTDVREIYRLRRNIMERLRRNADQFRWRLATGRNSEKGESKGERRIGSGS